MLADTKRDVLPNDEQAANFVVSNAVGTLPGPDLGVEKLHGGVSTIGLARLKQELRSSPLRDTPSR
ncbi:hypothetical protein A5722_30575 [Mycobacterium vulneris]|uniref:Uncharacterized protein n=1 Tax=Mycolicibacterium septicum DSM 44393 TaxID=1341646 RepID=A0A7X6MV43_9MYCO|nr:hypothetical protein [Mycolicibacterium septicum]OBK07206.1 hypothetical protein A5637_05675 [Mycolicibacterium fortuitum]OCB47909.1 hypothetical protein A5721_07390 [Mycolicibacterium vulneris]NKZ14938.1 hypothetical protein [Mycolicibacterium septicum DSM 44393]OBK59500.1 hypothetical protein A5654_31410 [Mycolicibacterium fortuitum]OCB51802.1 hypothetical protein A5722_30575 [Mycolicibacterium vulneris]